MSARLVPLAALAVLGLAACSTAPTGSATPTPTPVESAAQTATASPTPSAAPADGQQSCRDLVDRLSPEDRIGQLFMVGKTSTEPVDDTYRQMLADSRAGHVVLLGDSRQARGDVLEFTDTIREAAVRPEGIGLFVAVDQEGGAVQRLKGPGFEAIPSARVQAERPVIELERSAEHWGGQLRVAGVNANLVPVADVVPKDRLTDNEPIGRLNRNYGTTPEEVTPRVEAIVRGYRAANIATSLKHFPGLGYVVGNTDFSGNVVDDTIGRDHPDLAVFRAGIEAGADMVMLATASYDRIDPGVPAAFSSAVIDGMLRTDLGFQGVVISDDLGAAQQVADIAPGDRALRFLTAGGDIVINGDPSLQAAMTEAVRARAADDPAFADEIHVKATRVVTMKADHGMVACQPD